MLCHKLTSTTRVQFQAYKHIQPSSSQPHTCQAAPDISVVAAAPAASPLPVGTVLGCWAVQQTAAGT